MSTDDDQPKVQVSVRVNAADLDALERIGAEMKPLAVKRNAMVGLAIREYVERHATKPASKGKQGK